MNLKALCGRVVYFLSYPLLLFFLKGSTRAYVLLVLNGKVLLTQSTLDYTARWHLVGGGIKRGEALSQGVTREVKEELGIIINESNLVKLNDELLEAKHNYRYALFSYELEEAPKLTLRKYEITKAQFFAIDEISKIKISDTVQKALDLLALK